MESITLYALILIVRIAAKVRVSFLILALNCLKKLSRYVLTCYSLDSLSDSNNNHRIPIYIQAFNKIQLIQNPKTPFNLTIDITKITVICLKEKMKRKRDMSEDQNFKE